MLCSKCGKEIADDSLFCPECGQKQEKLVVEKIDSSVKAAGVTPTEVTPEIIAPAAAQPAAPATFVSAAAAEEAAAKAKAASVASTPVATTSAAQSTSSGSSIGAFFKEYFKNPISAVSKHSKKEFWWWGLISISAYLLLDFLVSLVGVGSIRGFGYEFGYFISNIIRFATLIFAYFLFQGVFKLKKKNLLSVIATVGLAFLPLLPFYLVGLIFDKIISYGSIISGLTTAAFVIAAIIMYSELKESSDDTSGTRSLLTIAISFACMPLISWIIDSIVYHVMYLSYWY
jgi:hypothetical protein